MKCTVTFDRIGRFTGLTAALPAEGRHPAADLVITADAYDRRGPLSRLRNP